MKFYQRHHFGPYADDYFVFIEDTGDKGQRIRHVAPDQVTFGNLEDAAMAAKLPAGAFLCVDVLVDRSGEHPTLEFDYEVHRSRRSPAGSEAEGDAEARAAAPRDVPLAEMTGGGGASAVSSNGPIPLSCSKDCPAGPDRIPCTEGTRPACNPNTKRLECVDDEA